MGTFLSIVGFVGGLAVIGLAVVGLGAVMACLSRESDERYRLQAQARRAEEQIMEIGLQAQLALLGEALQRVRGAAAGADSSNEDSGAGRG
jgi:hypothetical protein